MDSEENIYHVATFQLIGVINTAALMHPGHCFSLDLVSLNDIYPVFFRSHENDEIHDTEDKIPTIGTDRSISYWDENFYSVGYFDKGISFHKYEFWFDKHLNADMEKVVNDILTINYDVNIVTNAPAYHTQRLNIYKHDISTLIIELGHMLEKHIEHMIDTVLKH